jgi:predicted signal transduction protein with EAL and GGDEF domain
LVHSLLIKAQWYERNGLIEESFAAADHAEKLIEERHLRERKVDILVLKARLYAASDDYQQAYKSEQAALKAEIEGRDAINEERFQQLYADFELDQKEYENRLLSEANARQTAELALKSREQTITVLGIAVLMMLFVSIVTMYISVKRQQRKLEQLAQTDELTGLYNRRQSLILLEREIQLAVRQRNPLSVAVADLDDFKYINDTYGHQIGDEVLRHVSELMTKSFRKTDIIGRVGGEEFLFVFPASGCDEVATSLGELIKAVV